MDDEAMRIRRRALRAARVATLGLVLAAPGCYLQHERPPEVERVEVADAAPPSMVRVARDAGAPIVDAGTDAGIDCFDAGASWSECCDAIGWEWDRGCMAWGPFVPPADGEVA
jgi:hypothetical protein